MIEEETLMGLDMSGIEHLVINAKDYESFDLSSDFDRAADFIQRAIVSGNVFIHCQAGISRSASCLIAFYMKYRGMSYEKALAHIKQS